MRASLNALRSWHAGRIGLWLLIARDMAKKQGGNITLKNLPEGGLIITQVLPINAPGIIDIALKMEEVEDSKMALVQVVADSKMALAAESKLSGADRMALEEAGFLWHTYIAHTQYHTGVEPHAHYNPLHLSQLPRRLTVQRQHPSQHPHAHPQ